MADTTTEWRRQAPNGMHAIIQQARCGWHVTLRRTGSNMQSLLKPEVIGKSCVPYKPDGGKAVAQDQVEALAIGLYNIGMDVREDCNNL